LTVSIKDAGSKWDYVNHRSDKKYFNAASAPPFVHRENQFNDFTEQTLLVTYFSRQGPCMAKADINKDGLEDLFIGGAKNQPAQVFIQDKDGKWMNSSQ